MRKFTLLLLTLLPVTSFALTPEQDEAEKICDEHRAPIIYGTGYYSFSAYEPGISNYKDGFAICNKIMNSVNKQKSIDTEQKNKADLEKLNKLSVAIVKKCTE